MLHDLFAAGCLVLPQKSEHANSHHRQQTLHMQAAALRTYHNRAVRTLGNAVASGAQDALADNASSVQGQKGQRRQETGLLRPRLLCNVSFFAHRHHDPKAH